MSDSEAGVKKKMGPERRVVLSGEGLSGAKRSVRSVDRINNGNLKKLHSAASRERLWTGGKLIAQPSNRVGNNLDPEPIHQMMYSFAPSRVLFTGVRLGVFSHIASGKRTAREIAGAAKANERGVRMLLDALVACGLLRKKHFGKTSQYLLTPRAAKFLVRNSPDYLGGMIEHDAMWDAWQRLPESVRTGRPVNRVDQPNKNTKFFTSLVRSLHVISRDPAQSAARALGAGKTHKGMRVLDIACGSGVWGIAIAEADSQARVTAQDFPAILKETRKYARSHGVEDRYNYLPGDLARSSLGREQYDLALLGHILHIQGERSSRRLLRRVHGALRAGGRIVIAEMIPNDRRTGPPFPLFFALNMLLNTAVGDAYTVAEYRKWLQEAGFARIKSVDIGTHSPLIVASKR